MMKTEMIKYVCDICGKEIDASEVFYKEWKKLTLADAIYDNDVCPECVKGLIGAVRLMQRTRTSSVTEAMRNMLIETGQYDTKRFKLGDIIKYSPTEMRDIVEKRLKNE